MNDHMRDQVTKIIKEARDRGDMDSRATAFSLMKGILENSQPALSQIKDLDEILYIWNELENDGL